MNQKTIKNIGLLAILSLVTVSLSASSLTEAEARGVEVTSSIEDDRFNGHSGESAAAQTPELSAKAQQVAQAEAEAVTLSLEEFEFDGKSTNVSNDATTQNTSRYELRADDYGLETFEAIYTLVKSGDGDVRNVMILVSSDTETVSAQLLGELDAKHSVIAVEIKAVDPASISAEIISFEI